MHNPMYIINKSQNKKANACGRYLISLEIKNASKTIEKSIISIRIWQILKCLVVFGIKEDAGKHTYFLSGFATEFGKYN